MILLNGYRQPVTNHPDAGAVERLENRLRNLESKLADALNDADKARAKARRAEADAITLRHRLEVYEERVRALPSPGAAIAAVCEVFELSADMLTGPNRIRRVVRPRQAAAKLLSDKCGQSFVEIGRLLGYCDHTTARYGLQRAAELIKADPEFADAYARAVAMLDEVRE